MNARFYAKVPIEIIMCCFTKSIEKLESCAFKYQVKVSEW